MSDGPQEPRTETESKEPSARKHRARPSLLDPSQVGRLILVFPNSTKGGTVCRLYKVLRRRNSYELTLDVTGVLQTVNVSELCVADIRTGEHRQHLNTVEAVTAYLQTPLSEATGILLAFLTEKTCAEACLGLYE